MNKYEIIKKIENFAPPETAETWDCVGFAVETKRVDISKIMLCLTVTDDIIKQAQDQKCDMIISHHPLFEVKTPLAFSSCRQNFCHSELDSESSKILTDTRCCAVSDSFSPLIDIYSAHTNLDKANNGTTDTIISSLGMDEFKINIEHEFLRMVDFGEKIELSTLKEKLKTISPNLRYVNNKNVSRLQKIAFCAGSGSEFINEAKELGADCLVTGDLKFHTALDSEIVVFDIGHFESEILILPILKKIIGKGVEIIFAQEKSPFQI